MQKIQKLLIASVIVCGCFVHAKDPQKAEASYSQRAQDFAVGCAVGGGVRVVTKALYKQIWVENPENPSNSDWSPPAGNKWAHSVGLNSARDLQVLSDVAIGEIGRYKYEKMVGRASYSTLFGCIIGDVLANNINVNFDGRVSIKPKISISIWMVELLKRWFKN